MLNFESIIHRFEEKGEKTSWTYVDIPFDIAQQLKPDTRVSFRVKGWLDQVSIAGLALLPMGEGAFILPLKTSLRKALGKGEGALLNLQLEEDVGFKIETPVDLRTCLFEEGFLTRFDDLPKSHRHYFINWINAAKTSHTRVKRIEMTVNAMALELNYSQMMHYEKAKRNKL